MPLIRSQFHRRLIFLLAMVLLASLTISAQLARLTLIRGDELRARAESKLIRTRWLPTHRGRVLDRKGRVLARDRASYDLAIDYRVLTGEWAEAQARRFAYRAHRRDWSDLSREQRDELAGSYQPRFDAHLDAAWTQVARATGVSPAELGERAQAVVDRIDRMHASIAERSFERLLAEREQAGLTLDAPSLERLKAMAGRPIAEQRSPQIVLEDIGDEAGFALQQLADRRVLIFDPDAGQGGHETTVDLLPGLEVRNAADRVYPFDTATVEIDLSTLPRPLAADDTARFDVSGVAAHILGSVRTGAYKEDHDARAAALADDPALRARSETPAGIDRGRYFDTDAVGSAGVERSGETTLRGLRGLRAENLQTGAVTILDAEPGRDIQLTIDIALQARVRAIMDPRLGLATVQPWHKNETIPGGTPLYGAAVVLDIETGHILALVSTPTIPRDGDWSTLGLGSDKQVATFAKLTNPEINKAIAKPYPPGSVAKALIVCGSVSRGTYTLGERIEATGHLLPGRPDVFRSWVYKQYGLTHNDQLGRDPDCIDALMVSANVFFYTLGRRLGPQRLAGLYGDFGIGSAFNLGIGNEWPGKVGTVAGKGDGSDLASHDAILMGIGQGPITWTPLHAAGAYATIARGGIAIAPRIVDDGSAPETREVSIDAATRTAVLEGLQKVVTDTNHGSGYALRYEDDGTKEPIFRVAGVKIYGKTGTASAPPIAFDPDGDGPAPVTTYLTGDHSWFVVLAGPDSGDPTHAIAVVMDYAGSGGRVSGPMTDQIIRALVDEGYLKTSSSQSNPSRVREHAESESDNGG